MYKYNEGFDAIRSNLEDDSCGICAAPLDPQVALNVLTSYLLGDDWYTAMPMNTLQVNAVVVEQILDKYSKKWKKDWKNYSKELKKSK